LTHDDTLRTRNCERLAELDSLTKNGAIVAQTNSVDRVQRRGDRLLCDR
jgi:hypothetical protein